jgi:hypothetical protein
MKLNPSGNAPGEMRIRMVTSGRIVWQTIWEICLQAIKVPLGSLFQQFERGIYL